MARHEIGVGVLVIVAGGLLTFLALEAGAIRRLGDESIHVSAIMPDVAGLSEGAAVSVAGVPIGRVDKMLVDFDRAKLQISLDLDAGIRSDAKVALRARSVLGEKYVEIVPQTRDAPLLADGGVLTADVQSLEIDQLVTRMGPLLDAVDPEAVRGLIASMQGAVADDPERPKRMLVDAETVMHNLAVASAELPALVSEAHATLKSVRQTADEARPILQRMDGTVARLDSLVASVPPTQVPALLDEIAAALKDGRAMLVKLDAATGGVTQLLDKANGITRSDVLQVTQEEGVYIRLFPRKKEKVLNPPSP
jgi:phospholipid/cholesterol/gamma-HCH transport system substrate-binding protein